MWMRRLPSFFSLFRPSSSACPFFNLSFAFFWAGVNCFSSSFSASSSELEAVSSEEVGAEGDELGFGFRLPEMVSFVPSTALVSRPSLPRGLQTSASAHFPSTDQDSARLLEGQAYVSLVKPPNDILKFSIWIMRTRK